MSPSALRDLALSGVKIGRVIFVGMVGMVVRVIMREIVTLLMAITRVMPRLVARKIRVKIWRPKMIPNLKISLIRVTIKPPRMMTKMKMKRTPKRRRRPKRR